ncbi:GGDEF domain-containing protein [Thioclava sp. BHET1]|nr:GGDEF domain-containing protein [Thioclava sp. BHET1]
MHETTAVVIILLTAAAFAEKSHPALARGAAGLALSISLSRFAPGLAGYFEAHVGYAMGMNTALVLSAIAVAILLKSYAHHSVAAMICLFVSSYGGLMLAAFFTDISALLGMMSPVTALCSLALSIAVMLSRSNRGIMRVILSRHATGRYARLQLLLGMLIPVVLGCVFIAFPVVEDTRVEIMLLIMALSAFNIAVIVVTTVKMEIADHQRRQLERQMQELALRDGLTKVFNRVMLDRRFKRAVAAAERFDVPFSFLIIDLDHFKSINDLGGHELGDRVLQRAALTMRARLRMEDTLARIGGEEFAVVLPGATLEAAYEVAERLRLSLEEIRISHGGDGEIQLVTASIGIAQWCPHESMLEISSRTDRALYAAKAQGRNRVVVAEDPQRPLVPHDVAALVAQPLGAPVMRKSERATLSSRPSTGRLRSDETE